MSDAAKELAAALRFAAVVVAVLPVDDEADRVIAELMRRNRPTPTKSTRLIPQKASS